jgi:hypothetical protein
MSYSGDDSRAQIWQDVKDIILRYIMRPRITLLHTVRRHASLRHTDIRRIIEWRYFHQDRTSAFCILQTGRVSSLLVRYSGCQSLKAIVFQHSSFVYWVINESRDAASSALLNNKEVFASLRCTWLL